MSQSGAGSSYAQPKQDFPTRQETNDPNLDIYIKKVGSDFSENSSDEENDESKNIIDSNNQDVSNSSGQNGTTDKLLRANNNFGKNKHGFGDNGETGDDAELENQSSAASALVPYGNEEDQTTTSSASKIESFPDTDRDEVDTSRDGLKDRFDLGLTRYSQFVNVYTISDKTVRPICFDKRSIHKNRMINAVEMYRNWFKINSTNNDKFEETGRFKWYNMLMAVISIAIFCVDIGTDINLAVHYFREGFRITFSVYR